MSAEEPLVTLQTIPIAELKNAFDKVDTDNSGTLEFPELLKVCDSLPTSSTSDLNPNTYEEIEALFKDIDTNNDGKVSFDEFVAWYRIGRTTGLGELMKTEIAIRNGIKVVTDKFTEIEDKLSPEAERTKEVSRIIDIVLKDGKNPIGNTSARINLRTGEKNDMVEEMETAFKEEDLKSKEILFFYTMKAENPEALSKGIQTLIDNVILMLSETTPDLHRLATQFVIKIGHNSEKVFLVIDPSQSPLTKTFDEISNTFLTFFENSQMDISIQLNSSLDFSTCVNTASTAASAMSPVDSQNVMGTSDVLNLFFKGIYINLVAAINKEYQAQILSMYEEIKNEIPKHILSSVEEQMEAVKNDGIRGTYNIDDNKRFMKWLRSFTGKNRGSLPLSVDLVDTVGDAWAEFEYRFFDNYPFLEDFIECVKENGVFDIKIGASTRGAVASFAFSTPGTLELFEFIQQRLE